MSSYVITDETPYQDPYSRGTGSIVTERKGYILRTRGEHNRLVRHDYRCTEHGVFEAAVPSGDVPELQMCRTDVGGVPCGNAAVYQPPSVAQGWAAGKVKS